jgi:hypothetical protein
MTELMRKKRMRLSDVNVAAVSLVTKGANRNRFLLFKSGDQDADESNADLRTSTIIKASPPGGGDGWSAAYVVVAAPDTEEDPGMFGDQDTVDVWADPDEIRKAAHGFMRNGALVNRMHEDLEPFGQVVENAIALDDIRLSSPDGDQVIRKDSWYMAIEPTDEGRRQIDAGEFTGVSIQGHGTRTEDGEVEIAPVSKSDADLAYLSDYDRELLGQMDATPITKATDHPSQAHADLDWSKGENWIDKLPAALGAAFKRSWIYRAAKHLTFDVYGGNRGRAFAVAINAAKKGCATGDLNWPGAQSVNPKSKAEMCAAVSVWESMKGANAAQQLTKEAEAAIAKLDEAQDPTGMTGEDGVMLRLAKRLGLADEDFDPIVKRNVSQGERRRLADKGHAMADGSFPIASEQDLRNAIRAVGRASDPAAAKRHICKRAKALGLEKLLPDSWSALAKELGTVDDVDEAQVQELIAKGIKPVADQVATINAAVAPLAELPGQIEALSKRLDGDGNGDTGNGDGDGGEGEATPPADDLSGKSAEELAKLRDEAADTAVERINKINAQIESVEDAAGKSTQTGDEVALAKSGGDNASDDWLGFLGGPVE